MILQRHKYFIKTLSSHHYTFWQKSRNKLTGLSFQSCQTTVHFLSLALSMMQNKCENIFNREKRDIIIANETFL